jgi:hypothetical protein
MLLTLPSETFDDVVDRVERIGTLLKALGRLFSR